jgi:hypothetical protein
MSRRAPIRAPRAERNEPPSRRLPAFVLAAVLLATALWVRERGDEIVTLVPSDRQPAELAPVGADPDGVASTWYCAGGTASAGGAADHFVIVTNVGANPVTGRVQAFPVNADPGPPAPFDLPAGGRRALRVGDLVAADHAAALVEMRGGPVFVEHEVRGPSGHDLSRCASRPSASWYFPWGQTTLGSSLRLALFNPFPGDAVVDITFDTEDGYRSPENLQALLVPARRLVVVDVESLVTRRQRVSTRIEARAGRIVADRVQTLTAADGQVAVDVSGGAPAAASTWYFADGRVDAGTLERLVVFNPGDRTAEASVSLLTGTTGPAQVEPFQLRLAPGAAAELTLNNETRVAQPLLHATLVQAEGDVPVVAERVLLTGGYIAASPGAAAPTPGAPPTSTAPPPPPAPPADGSAAASALPPLPAGVAASLGEPLVARRWVAGLPLALAPPGGAPGQITVLNPSGAGPVQVRVELAGAGGGPSQTLQEASIEPGRRLGIDVPGDGRAFVTIEASGSVVVGRVLPLGEPPGLAAEGALASAGTAEVADPDR